jgi:hypothetical protein
MKFTCNDTEMRNGVKEMVPMFTMKGSAQFSEHHGLLKSTVLFSECHVIKVYECAWLKIS